VLGFLVSSDWVLGEAEMDGSDVLRTGYATADCGHVQVGL
jgi:hypothetical protein